MKAELRRKVCGRQRTFAMPLAAIEEVSAVNEFPRQLGIALTTGYAKKSEVFAIVEAGAKHGEADIGLEEIYAEIGLSGMEALATDLWLLAWKDDSGNSLAAGKTAETAASRSGDGSASAE